ncbi:MAG: hypothetical protein U0794_10885 [Isosphaeraceae bacterium]
MSSRPTGDRSLPRIAVSLVVVLVLAVSTSSAQTSRSSKPPRGKGSTTVREKGSSTTPAEAGAKDPEPQGFLGDPKRFTRFGGWGSMGGAIGQFGFARSMLVMMPAVQQELKLTAEQKEQVRLWQEESRERGEEWGRKMREQNGGETDPFQSNDTPLAARILQFTSLMSQVTNLAREGETSLAKILDRNQRQRLNQIALQMEGLSALSRPEVAESLNLDDDQIAMIQQILAQARIMQMTSWVETGMSMSRMRRGPRTDGDRNGPPSTTGESAATSSDPPRTPRTGAGSSRSRNRTAKNATPSTPTSNDAGDATSGQSPTEPETRTGPASGPGGRDRPTPEQQKEMQRHFLSMRERTDRIQEQAVREISRVLTKRQKANFDKMLGPPFDPSKINLTGRPPGSRGPATGGSSIAPNETKPSAPPSERP